MSVNEWFTTTALVYRQVWTTTGDIEKSSRTMVGQEKGSLVRSNRQSPELKMYPTEKMTDSVDWIAPLDTIIKRGDELVIDGNKYTVRLIVRNNFGRNVNNACMLEMAV